MKISALVICLCATPLPAQLSGVMSMNCNSAKPASVNEQLQQLAGPIPSDDKVALECRFSYMKVLSRSQDPRALLFITHYLDTTNPNIGKPDAPESRIFRPFPFQGRFPAIIYITEYKKDAIPVLIQTIASEPELSLRAKNAVRALMIVEAGNPPAGVQALAQAARSAGSPHSAVLLEAARFATTTWECHSIIDACKNSLAPSGSP